MLWHPRGSLTRGVTYEIRLGIKGFHMPLKACAYRKKGDGELNAIQFVLGVRVELMQESI